jgi:hypothetical protein
MKACHSDDPRAPKATKRREATDQGPTKKKKIHVAEVQCPSCNHKFVTELVALEGERPQPDSDEKK